MFACLSAFVIFCIFFVCKVLIIEFANATTKTAPHYTALGSILWSVCSPDNENLGHEHSQQGNS